MKADSPASGSHHTRIAVVLVVAFFAAIFVGANIHLVYVAFKSQPGCVDHARTGEAEPGRYAAAKSSC